MNPLVDTGGGAPSAAVPDSPPASSRTLAVLRQYGADINMEGPFFEAGAQQR